MTINDSRLPYHLLPHNQELLKSLAREDGPTTNYEIDPSISAAQVPSYPVAFNEFAPPGRADGCPIFRRYADGVLDVEYAATKVIDALHAAGECAPLDKTQQDALSCLFPASFAYVDSMLLGHVMMVSLKITAKEAAMVALRVADHIRHEVQFMLSSHAR